MYILNNLKESLEKIALHHNASEFPLITRHRISMYFNGLFGWFFYFLLLTVTKHTLPTCFAFIFRYVIRGIREDSWERSLFVELMPHDVLSDDSQWWWTTLGNNKHYSLCRNHSPCTEPLAPLQLAMRNKEVHNYRLLLKLKIKCLLRNISLAFKKIFQGLT